MANAEFILKSGVKLQITTARFEIAVNLVEAVRKTMQGQDPGAEFESVVLANPDVRRAVMPALDTVLYGTVRASANLFDDPKIGEQARGDYFEILMHVIEVNVKPFFLRKPLESTASEKTTEGNPG